MTDISWIKLKTDMFDDEKIRVIQALPEADAVLVVWIRLLTLAGRTNDGGLIYLDKHIPYTDEILATLFNKPVNIIRLALSTLVKFNMIEILENGTILISNWEKHQNVEGLDKVRKLTAERNKRYRERKKILELGLSKTDNLSDVLVTSRDATESESDKESDKEDYIDYNFQFFYNFYQNNFGIISPNKLEQLRELFNEVEIKELLLEALKVSDNYNAKSPIDYTRKILNQWSRENVKSIEDINALRIKSQKQQKKINSYSNNRDKVIPVPEWTNPDYHEEMTDEEVAEFKRQLEALGEKK